MTSLADTKHLFIERFMAHRILYLAKTTHGSRDSRVLLCDEIINSLCSRPSAARFARIIHCFEENNDKHTVARNLN